MSGGRIMLKELIFAIFCLTVKASVCPDGSLEWQTNCLFFHNNTNGFAAAEVECVGNGGHLVSIHDAFTNTLLAQEGGNHFPQSTMTDFWIGLTDMTPFGNWSWTDGTLLDFTDWAKGEPKNISGYNCVSLSITDGFWRPDDCFKTKPYICKVDKSLFVPPTTAKPTTKYPVYADCYFPFTYFEPTHSCYGVGNFTGPLNWTLGEQYCQAFGAHLTSLHSSEEALFLGSLVYIGHNSYWTGAFSNDGGNSWEWSDRSPWDYNPWTNGYPKLHQNACGILWGGAIGDTTCNRELQIICRKPL